MYGDEITGSMKYAIDETDRRRRKQILYNKNNKISPKTIKSKISDIIGDIEEKNLQNNDVNLEDNKPIKENIKELKKQMEESAFNLEFEEAAKLRDKIKFLQKKELGLLSLIKK